MKVTFNAKLHNKFEIEVRDANTGELKQKAFAYNVILNNFFYGMLDSGRWHITHVGIGSGTGTPAITDSAPFNNEITKSFYSDTITYAYPTSYRTMKARIETTEVVGKTLTEVALGNWESPSAAGRWLTHAMIQDAEGHTISIAKTDTDVIYITAIFYCTVTHSGFGNNAVYPASNYAHAIPKILLAYDTSTSSYLMASRRTFDSSDSLDAGYSSSKSISIFSSKDYASLRFGTGTVTVLDSEWNNRVIKSVGIPGIGIFSLPDNSAFTDYAVTNIAIGTGDGSTTEFSIKAPLIKSGTGHVYVNGTEVAATDYTLDYESNCCDTYENYYTSDMEATGSSAQVVFGNFASLTGTSTIYDPFAFGYHDGWKKTNKPSSATISASNPIWIDFGSAKECNRLKITRNSPPAMTIEYSNDNTTWTAVTATAASNVYSFDKVSARYWRIYPTSGTWSAGLTEYADLNGISTGAYIFLGKTAPGIKFNTAPAEGAVITASYTLDVPFKTSNNLLRFECIVQLQRG